MKLETALDSSESSRQMTMTSLGSAKDNRISRTLRAVEKLAMVPSS
jgi:hypothetical protein